MIPHSTQGPLWARALGAHMAGATLPPSTFRRAHARHRAERSIEAISPPLKARSIWPLAVLAGAVALALLPVQHAVTSARQAVAGNELDSHHLSLAVVSSLGKVTESGVTHSQ